MADGNFTNINATGNVYAGRQFSTAGNITGGIIRSSFVITATGNITGGNLVTSGQVSATGNIRGNYFLGNGALLTGITSSNAQSAITVTGNAQPNVTTVGTLLNLSVLGTTRVSNVIANGHIISSGNVSAVNLLASRSVSVTGNVSGQYIFGNGAYLTGLTATAATSAATVTSSSQPNITSVGLLSSLSVFGGVNAYNFIAGGAVQATGNIRGNYIFGNGAFLTGISGGGSSNVAITVSGNSQPNITSVGNLTSLTVTGNVSAAYFKGDGSQLTGISGGGSSSRSNASASTGTLASNGVANVVVSGYKGYALYSIQTSSEAWVTVYSSNEALQADSTRPIDVDPVPGSGVIAEVITPGASKQNFTPAVVGFSTENVPNGNIPVKVVNTGTTPANIIVTLTLLKMES